MTEAEQLIRSLHRLADVTEQLARLGSELLAFSVEDPVIEPELSSAARRVVAALDPLMQACVVLNVKTDLFLEREEAA